MTIAANLQSIPSVVVGASMPAAIARPANAAVTRDFAVLIGVCLAVGVATGLAMMLAVLLLA